MKIEYNDGKIIVYLYQYILSFNNRELLNNEIKNLFIKLIRKYHLNLFGYNNIFIYENKLYGSVIEIDNRSVDNYYSDIIDIKMTIYNDVKFSFIFDNDELIDISNEMYHLNNHYYLDIKRKEDIYKYIEYGKIIYKKEVLK